MKNYPPPNYSDSVSERSFSSQSDVGYSSGASSMHGYQENYEQEQYHGNMPFKPSGNYFGAPQSNFGTTPMPGNLPPGGGGFRHTPAQFNPATKPPPLPSEPPPPLMPPDPRSRNDRGRRNQERGGNRDWKYERNSHWNKEKMQPNEPFISDRTFERDTNVNKNRSRTFEKDNFHNSSIENYDNSSEMFNPKMDRRVSTVNSKEMEHSNKISSIDNRRQSSESDDEPRSMSLESRIQSLLSGSLGDDFGSPEKETPKVKNATPPPPPLPPHPPQYFNEHIIPDSIQRDHRREPTPPQIQMTPRSWEEQKELTPPPPSAYPLHTPNWDENMPSQIPLPCLPGNGLPKPLMHGNKNTGQFPFREDPDNARIDRKTSHMLDFREKGPVKDSQKNKSISGISCLQSDVPVTEKLETSILVPHLPRPSKMENDKNEGSQSDMEIDDDNMSLSSIGSGEHKIEVNPPLLMNDSVSYSQSPAATSTTPWMMTSPSTTAYSDGINYGGNMYNHGSFNTMYFNNYNNDMYNSGQGDSVKSITDPREGTFKSVLEGFVNELKEIMQKDLCKKMVQTSAFKSFETWWDVEEKKNTTKVFQEFCFKITGTFSIKLKLLYINHFK